jgi:hypothetical protein
MPGKIAPLWVTLLEVKEADELGIRLMFVRSAGFTVVKCIGAQICL